MHESSAGSWQENSHLKATPNINPQSFAHIPPAPEVLQLDKHLRLQSSTSPSERELQDDETEVDPDTQARQMRQRERVVILRNRVFRTRQLKRKRRDELRQLRENVRDALDKLTRKINEFGTFGEAQEDITLYTEKFRAAQDELGPAEDEFEYLENRLDDEEENLEQEEEHFYRHNNVFAISVPNTKLDDALSPLVRPYRPADTELQPLDLEQDLLQEYLGKVEEATRLKEELEDLENDYLRLLGEAAFRKRHGIALSEETAMFLADYPQTYVDILENVHEVEDTLFNLRYDCLDKGLFTDSEHVYEPYDALSEEVRQSVDEAQDRSPLRAAAHHLKRAEHTKTSDEKRNFVNTWLLEWAQDSPLEVWRLKTFIFLAYPESPEKPEVFEDDKWSELALQNWDTDNAGAMTSKFYNASKLDAIAGETGRLGATTTGRSRLSDSLRSLDVVLDELGMEEEMNVAIETGAYILPSRDTEITLKKSNDRSIPSIKLPNSQTWPLMPHSEFAVPFSTQQLDRRQNAMLSTKLKNGHSAGLQPSWSSPNLRKRSSF
jgi:hypothetical protein